MAFLEVLGRALGGGTWHDSDRLDELFCSVFFMSARSFLKRRERLRKKRGKKQVSKPTQEAVSKRFKQNTEKLCASNTEGVVIGNVHKIP